jgi:translation initiation factor 2B subunit (eIF-2B alpha/beta/delta family)
MDTSNPLSKLLFDNTSGSSAILEQLTSFITKNEGNGEQDWKVRTREILDFGFKELKQFQVVFHFLQALDNELTSLESEKALFDWIYEYEKEWSSLPEKWADSIQNLIPDTNAIISTHSQSESLKKVLRLLSKSGYELKILQAQSSPANEGELQANWLVNKGIEVVLTTDAIAPAFVEQCDLVILGCDGIYSNGFVNKAGSLALCLAAAQFNKPVYILADTRKISHDLAPEETPKASTEVTSRSHPNLEVLNLYFEVVPHGLVTGYITEKGILEENI